MSLIDEFPENEPRTDRAQTAEDGSGAPADPEGGRQADYWGRNPVEPDLGEKRPDEEYDDRMLPDPDDDAADLPFTFGSSDRENSRAPQPDADTQEDDA